MTGASGQRSPHQTGTAYNQGCKCDVCASTHNNRMADGRINFRERTKNRDPAVPHGTTGGYRNWSCRCPECTDAGLSAYRAGGASVRFQARKAAERDGRPVPEWARKQTEKVGSGRRTPLEPFDIAEFAGMRVAGARGLCSRFQCTEPAMWMRWRPGTPRKDGTRYAVGDSFCEKCGELYPKVLPS